MILIRRIVGTSMLPKFRPGTIVFGLRYKRPKTGDVIIARYRNLEIVKRIQHSGNQGYFLLGDNPAESSDSRDYGWFNHKAIQAVIIGRIPR